MWILTSRGGILRVVLSSRPKKVKSTRRRDYRVVVRGVANEPMDARRYAKVLLTIAMERRGITPSWAWPKPDATLLEDVSDGAVGDVEVGADGGK